MFKETLRISIISSLLILGSASDLKAASNYENKTVYQIEVLSLDEEIPVDKDAILKTLHTRTQRPFDQEAFDQDLKHLSTNYDKIQTSIKEEGEQLFITLELKQKPLISSVRFKGNKKIGKTSLNKELSVKKGEVLDQTRLNESIAKLRAHYIRKGYYKAKIDSTLESIPGMAKKNLIFQIDEGPSGKVRKLIFEGITAEEKEKILERTITQTYKFWSSWYTSKGYLIEEALEYDRANVVTVLQDLGYADATAKTTIDADSRKDGLVITFKVDKGEKYTVNGYELVGVDALSREKIEKFITVKSGDTYSPDRLREIIKNMNDYYGTQGYINAFVTYEPKLTGADSHSFDIEFSVDEGKSYKVGFIRFAGNYITKPRVIRHESLLVPGQILDTRKMKSTENRLMNTGYFNSVHIRTAESRDQALAEDNFKDIIIDLDENNASGRFGLQFGANSSSSFIGLSGAENNFNYKGLSQISEKGPSSLRGNGEFLNFQARAEKRANSVVLSWTDPYIFDSAWSFGIDLDKQTQRNYNSNFYTKTGGVTFHGSRLLNNFLRFKTYISLRDNQIRVSPGAKELKEDQTKNNGFATTIGAGLSHDSTNHMLKPTSGWRSSLGGSFTGVLDKVHYMQYHFLNVYYIPLSKKNTFIVRGDIEFTQPLGSSRYKETPITSRYFLGGESSLRGYRLNMVGPRQANNIDPAGGISSYIYSLEMRRELREQIALFAFFDGGGLSKEEFKFGANYNSYGWGVRFDVMGRFPIIMGYGYPLRKHTVSEKKNFFFTIGGRF